MQLLEETESLCPACMKILNARIYSDGVRVFMEKKCPDHGVFRGLIWSDYSLYKKSFRFGRRVTKPAEWNTSTIKGCPYDFGLCPEHEQHTCLTILEITEKCNLGCPVCLASSPGTRADPKIEQIEGALRKLVKCEGSSTSIQISGGEPTVREDLADIISVARGFGFKSIEIDTNGVELARHPMLAKQLAAAGLSGIYLQFDGLTREAELTIRGASNLLALKEKAIETARKAGLEVALAATIVKGVNDDQLWEIIKYAISKDAKGVNFQPFAALGRFPSNFDPMHKVTVSDIVTAIEKQSGGKLKSEDFVSVPCPDNRCAVLSCMIIRKGKITPLNRMVEVENLLEHYAEPSDFDGIIEAAREIYSIKKAEIPCCSASMDLFKGQYFSIGCHGLQDIWNIDLNRVKKCCVHELTMEGRLVPFCLFSLTSQNGETIYRSAQPKTFI